MPTGRKFETTKLIERIYFLFKKAFQQFSEINGRNRNFSREVNYMIFTALFVTSIRKTLET